MKILLTGGTGQLGSEILNQLAHHDIYAPTRSELNILDSRSLLQEINAFKPEIIINSAAWTDVQAAETYPEDVYRINVEGVMALATAGAKVGAKFFQISTDYVFDGKSNVPYLEDSKKNPLSVYGKTKSWAEDFLVSSFPETSVVFRTSWLYGPTRRNFVKSILKKLLSTNDAIEVVDDQIGSPTSTFEVCKALEIFLQKKYKSGIFHLTCGGEASWYELAKAIAKLSKIDIERIIPISSKEFSSDVVRPEFSVLNSNKFEILTGHKMQNWRDALSFAYPNIRSAVDQEIYK